MSDEKFKYCVKCGQKNELSSLYCKNCGHKFATEDVLEDFRESSHRTNSDQIIDKHFNREYSEEYAQYQNEIRERKRKKYIVAGILVILIVFVSAATVLVSAGGADGVQYLLKANEIQITSVSQTDYQKFVADSYSGSAKVYNIQFLTKEDLTDTSIEVYGYDSNNQLLDVVGSFFGTNETNVILSNNTAKNTLKSADVAFAKRGADDFQLSYLKVFVYKNQNGNKQLVDKFTYKVN